MCRKSRESTVMNHILQGERLEFAFCPQKKIKNKNKGGMELIKSTHEIVTMADFDEGSCPVIDVFKMFSVIAFGGSTKLLIAIKIASL